MDIQRVTELFTEVEQILEKYGDQDYSNSYRESQCTTGTLPSDESNGEKKQNTLKDYKFPFYDGNTPNHFTTHFEDREKVIILTQQIKEIRMTLEKIIKMIETNEDE